MLKLGDGFATHGLEGRLVNAAALMRPTCTQWIELVNEAGSAIDLVKLTYRTAERELTLAVNRRLANHGFVDVEFEEDDARVTGITVTLRREGEERSYPLSFNGSWVLWASIQIYDDPTLPFGLLSFSGE
jgi:hypothetical protein